MLAGQPPAGTNGSASPTDLMCAAFSCANGGRCVASPVGPVCDCIGTGFGGPSCEQTDPCRGTNGCSDGAQCVVSGATRTCTCPSGMIGDGIGPNGCRTPLRGIAAGTEHFCALSTEGTVKCWGSNDRGELGDGTRTRRAKPAVVSGLIDVVEISLGGSNSCARQRSGSVLCWGELVGNIVATDSTQPVPVLGLTSPVAISAGRVNCALSSQGTVQCWGCGTSGLGDGRMIECSVEPVQVANLSDAVEVNGHFETKCARRSDATAVCWVPILGVLCAMAPIRIVRARRR